VVIEHTTAASPIAGMPQHTLMPWAGPGRESVDVMIRPTYTRATVSAEGVLVISPTSEGGGNVMYANTAPTAGHIATGRIVLTKSALVVAQLDGNSLGYESVSLI
jgi:hypothetical protein